MILLLLKKLMANNTISFERTPAGIPVITQYIEDSPNTGFMVGVNTGSRDEESRVFGISHLLEHVVFRATKTRSSFQMSKEIEGAGGEMNAFTSKENTAYYAVTLTETMNTAKDLVADIVCNPLINPDDVEMEKKIVLQELSMCENDPSSYIHDLFSETIWRNHDLGHNEGGTSDVVKKLNDADLKEYYSNKYVTQNLAVFACGNVDKGEVMDWAMENFDCMTSSKGNIRIKPSVQPACYKHFLRKEDHCYVGFGFPAFSADHEDRIVLSLLNAVIGTGSSSRMFQQVREEKALVYSIYNYVDQNSDAGSFATYFSSTEENVKEAVDTVTKVYRDLKSNGVTQEELTRARNLIKGATVRYMESTDHKLHKLARNFMLSGEIRSEEERIKALDSVTVEDVMRVADKLIDSNKVTVVMYGNDAESMKNFSSDEVDL